MLSNQEFSWDREGLTDVSPVCGPSERISVLEVDAAIGKKMQGKSGGPTGVVSEMLKAAGETDVSRILLVKLSHKNLGSATSHLFFRICIGFRFATELVSKLPRLLSECSNLSS